MYLNKISTKHLVFVLTDDRAEETETKDRAPGTPTTHEREPPAARLNLLTLAKCPTAVSISLSVCVCVCVCQDIKDASSPQPAVYTEINGCRPTREG